MKRIGSTALLAVALFSASAMAQDFPTRPVRLVVANGAGSITDIAARLIGPGMSKALGQPVVIEPMPGASGLIASEYVARQPGDGYTLLYGSNNLVLLPVFVKDLKLDPVRDLPPVSIVTELISLVSSSAQAPWTTFNDMIAYIKANPGKVNYASTGLNGATTMNLEVLKSKAGLVVTNIPYKNGSPDVLRVLTTNEAQFSTGLVESFGVAEKGNTNRFRVLAAVSGKRLPSLPDVPSTAELGYPELIVNYFSIHSPAGVPKAVIDRLYAALASSLQQNEVREGHAKAYLHLVGSTPEASAKRYADEIAYYAVVAKKAGIKPE
jgi:tripartite-type tricarboxylate transporter receptor subunit TctC